MTDAAPLMCAGETNPENQSVGGAVGCQISQLPRDEAHGGSRAIHLNVPEKETQKEREDGGEIPGGAGSHLRWRVGLPSTPGRPARRSPETPSASSAWRPTGRLGTNPENQRGADQSLGGTNYFTPSHNVPVQAGANYGPGA